VAVAVLAEIWWFEKTLKKVAQKIKKGGSGICRMTVGWGVAVVGWEWCHSTEEIEAVRMV
jgi:hypothetical protein